MLTKVNKIEFSGKKREFAELLSNPDENATITDMCKRVGVSRTTFYKWIEDENYRAYIDRMIDSYTNSELANVWKAVIKKALQGDVSAQKLYFELKGKYKQQIDMSGTVVIAGEDNIAE